MREKCGLRQYQSLVMVCSRLALLPGLRCDALVKLDMVSIVFKGAMKR